MQVVCMVQTKGRGSSGLSLVEVLIAITIIAFAGGALFALFQSGALETKIGEDRIKAMMIAQQEIERAKQIGQLGRGSLEAFWAAAKDRKRSYMAEGFYHVTVEVDPVKTMKIGSAQAELGQITVAVRWSRPGRKGQRVELSSLFDQAYH